jgi:antitoxin YefM
MAHHTNGTPEKSMRIINLSDTHDSLRSVLEQMNIDADLIVISRCGASPAVIMPVDYYTSLVETVHLLSSPANAAHLARSLDQASSGRDFPCKLSEGP